ncbi:MAG: lytic transglycosylase domain-containing protein [Rickettsiaceae bacterium]
MSFQVILSTIIILICISSTTNANQITDKQVLDKIDKSQKYLKGSGAFKEITAFIKANPNWPEIDKLYIIAEKSINSKTDLKIVFDWFSKRSPKTGNGYKFYAYSSSKFMSHNDQHKLAQIIKNGWIYGTFTIDEEKQYQKSFSKYLSKLDYVAKVNEYLWNADISRARRLLPFVDANYRKTFESTFHAINNKIFPTKTFRQIIPRYYTSSLLFQYLNLNKTKPCDYDVSVFKAIPKEKFHSSNWHKLQIYYAREFLELKKYNNAYQIMTSYIPDAISDVADSEFLSGWIALIFLKKPNLALNHFNNFLKIVNKPMSLARVYYWIARTYRAIGNATKAQEFYKQAAKYQFIFYGQIAALELNYTTLSLPATPIITKKDQDNIQTNELYNAVRILLKKKNYPLAVIYAKHAIAKAKAKGEILLIARLIKSTNNVHYTADIAKTAIQYGVFIREFAFPTPYRLVKPPVDPALIYSIIRQESLFDATAASYAKAFGLMQLIEKTASSTAKSIKTPFSLRRLKSDAYYNIKIGSAHLHDLLTIHHNSYILTSANYDAAPNSVNRWIKLFGNPAKMKNIHDVINWIELVPFYETRNYIQRILENVQIYRLILNKNNQLGKLRSDMGC